MNESYHRHYAARRALALGQPEPIFAFRRALRAVFVRFFGSKA